MVYTLGMLETSSNNPDNSLQNKKIDHLRSLKAKANLERDPVTLIADKLNEYFGSTAFLLANLFIFTLWILINSRILTGLPSFDEYPFNFLTMTVSLEAIFLAIFVLISQNRQTAIADLREEVSLQIALLEQKQNVKILKMLDELHVHFKLKKTGDRELKLMEKLVNTDELTTQLVNEIKRNK